MPLDITSFAVQPTSTNFIENNTFKEFLEFFQLHAQNLMNNTFFLTLNIDLPHEINSDKYNFIVKLLFTYQAVSNIVKIDLYLMVNSCNEDISNPKSMLAQLTACIHAVKQKYVNLIDAVDNIMVCGNFNLPLSVSYTNQYGTVAIIGDDLKISEIDKIALVKKNREDLVATIKELLGPLGKIIRASYVRENICDNNNDLENNYEEQPFSFMATILISQNKPGMELTDSIIHNYTLSEQVVMQNICYDQNINLEDAYILQHQKLIIFTHDNIINVFSTYTSLEVSAFKIHMQRLPEILYLMGISKTKICSIFSENLLKILPFKELIDREKTLRELEIIPNSTNMELSTTSEFQGQIVQGTQKVQGVPEVQGWQIIPGVSGMQEMPKELQDPYSKQNSLDLHDCHNTKNLPVTTNYHKLKKKNPKKNKKNSAHHPINASTSQIPHSPNSHNNPSDPNSLTNPNTMMIAEIQEIKREKGCSKDYYVAMILVKNSQPTILAGSQDIGIIALNFEPANLVVDSADIVTQMFKYFECKRIPAKIKDKQDKLVLFSNQKLSENFPSKLVMVDEPKLLENSQDKLMLFSEKSHFKMASDNNSSNNNPSLNNDITAKEESSAKLFTHNPYFLIP